MKKDISNKRFGKLIALCPTDERSGSHIVWLCQCDCGNMTKSGVGNLISGHKKSCGCLIKETKSLPHQQSAINQLFYIYKRNANRRNIEFNLTVDLFKELIIKNCYYCGLEPNILSKFKLTNGQIKHNGIDRLENTEGYTSKNCVPCCKQCNYAKRDYSIEEFREWLSRVYKCLMV